MEQSLDITKIYNHAAETIKNAILKGQYEAAKGVNRVQLLTYLAHPCGCRFSMRKHIRPWMFPRMPY